MESYRCHQSLTPPSQQRTSLATSLEADEELLASMIHLAQHLGDSSGSGTWGNHVSLSSGNDCTENGSNTAATSQGQEGDVAKPSQSPIDREKDAIEEADVNTTSAAETCVADNDDNTLTASKMAAADEETTKSEPMQQSQLGDKQVRQTSTSSAAVTRLVYQEVEDYRERLQRKRRSMEMEAGSTTTTSNNISDSASSSSQAEELNELLLENAASISNALLLQRALYSLGIHASDNVVDGGSSASRTSSNGSQGGASINVGGNLNTTIPRAHSEHTGINRMALNHLRQTLSKSGTAPARRESPSTITSSSPPLPQANNAQWNTFSSTTSSNNSSNPFTALFNRRRFTYQEGAESAAQAVASPQIGAYHSNEPAPLLFRRTFNANAPNRRASRAEARRNTLETLALEDTAREESASATRNRSCPATMFETDIFDDDSSSSSSSDDGTYTRSTSLADQANVRNSSSTIAVSNTTELAITSTSNNVSPSGQSAGDQGSSFRPATIAPNQTSNRPRGGSQLSSTTTNRSSLISSTNTRESIRSIGWNDLEELSNNNNNNLNESDETTQTNNNNSSSGLSRQGLRSYLMASVRRQSYNSRRMIQAILVSDEIVEATPSTHNNNNDADVEMMGEQQQSEIQARLIMMEELLEEQDEEQRRILERYYKRERILIVLVSVSVAVILALIVVIIVV